MHRHAHRQPPLPAEALKEKMHSLFMDVPPADLIELADPDGVPAYFLGRPMNNSEAFARRPKALALNPSSLRAYRPEALRSSSL